MSWRDRATVINNSSGSGWKSRAMPVGNNEDTLLDRTANYLRPANEIMGKAFQMGMESPGVKYSPLGTMLNGRAAVQSLADTAGEAIAEELAKSKIPLVSNPYISAGIGTVVQNLPSALEAVSIPMPRVEEPILQPPLSYAVPRKILSYVGDVPESSIKFKALNTKAVNTAPSLAEIASKEIPAIANKFDQILSGLKSEADKHLSTSRYLQEGAFTKDEVINSVASARRKLGGVYTAESEMASRVLSKINNNLKKIRNTISQKQVKNLIDDVDNEIPWDRVWRTPQDLTMADKALIDVRTRLDGLLKKRNTPYADVMKPLSEAIETRNNFLKNLNLEKTRGSGYQPSNQTTSRLLGATKENRLETRRILKDVQENTGEDLQNRVESSRVKADFEPDTGSAFNPKGIRQIIGRPLVSKAIDLGSEIGKTVWPATRQALNMVQPTAIFAPGLTQKRTLNLLPVKKAYEYFLRAGKNKNKAREMALNDGWRLK